MVCFAGRDASRWRVISPFDQAGGAVTALVSLVINLWITPLVLAPETPGGAVSRIKTDLVSSLVRDGAIQPAVARG